MNDWHVVLECDLLQGMSYHFAKKSSMGSFPFKDDPKSNNTIGDFLQRDFLHDDWNLERAWHAMETHSDAS